MSAVDKVPDYGQRSTSTPIVPSESDNRSPMERIRDSHRESVRFGAIGPLVLLAAFVSSTLTLLYHGALWIYTRCMSLVR